VIHGLSEDHFKLLNTILLQPLRELGLELWVFGSRARGTQSQFSDVDILFSMTTPSPETRRRAFQAPDQLKESRFPFRVDLVDLEDLATSYRDQVLSERRKL
jgi:predicted nucleotidyltransferase